MTSASTPGSCIVFYDPVCPAPYSRELLECRGLGGSEACVVRVAEALDARVMQRGRRTAEGRYLPPGSSTEAKHVIVLRDARALRAARRRFPNARLYVWLHDLAAPGSTRGNWLAEAAPDLPGVTLICVSEFLRTRVAAIVDRLGLASQVRVITIFNPIDDDLGPGAGRVDDTKLVFLSSPNKGLGYALTVFQGLRRAIPGIRLFVANPGYRQFAPIALPDVVWLGTLSPSEAMAHARSALCVFMPNILLPETFGLVFAEANAVGTPVLAHDVGAAREVLHGGNPLLPVSPGQRFCARLSRTLGTRGLAAMSKVQASLGVYDDYLGTLRQWRSGERPRVTADARFRLRAVAAQWRKVLAV